MPWGQEGRVIRLEQEAAGQPLCLGTGALGTGGTGHPAGTGGTVTRLTLDTAGESLYTWGLVSCEGMEGRKGRTEDKRQGKNGGKRFMVLDVSI